MKHQPRPGMQARFSKVYGTPGERVSSLYGCVGDTFPEGGGSNRSLLLFPWSHVPWSHKVIVFNGPEAQSLFWNVLDGQKLLAIILLTGKQYFKNE